jgi:hypothetical protein
VKLIHHSVLRKDDLVNKLYETIKVSKTGDEDQKPATDQQQQQLPAEAAAQAANVTKKLLNHFLIYVGALCAPNDVDTDTVQHFAQADPSCAMCRWQTSRSLVCGCARTPGCRSTG